MSCIRENTAVQHKRRLQYLRGRLGSYALTLAAVLILNFWLPRLLPGDPLVQLAGVGSGSDMGLTLDAESQAALRAYYGLDRPLYEQFLTYCGNLLHGHLGYSHYFKAPVTELVADRLPWSVLLMLTGSGLAVTVGISAGAWSAWRRGSAWDQGLWVAFTVLRAIPVFFLGSVLLILLAIKLPLFPVFGAMSVAGGTSASWSGRLTDMLWHLTLPALTLALGEMTAKYMIARSAVLDTLREDYITYSRARGFSEGEIMFKHALPNAMLPVVTHVAMRLGMLVSGAIYVETLFGYPGMGKLLYNAVAVRDLQVLQGGFLVISLTVLSLNLALDWVYAKLDPRLEV